MYVGIDSEFIMNGGYIAGNNSPDIGGGVYVGEYGNSFTMNGGSVTGNTADTYGGGVYIEENGSFTMNDGSIKGNTAGSNGASCSGGGVYVGGTGSITMNDGSITENSAASGGGGVYLEPYGTFTIEGGSITKNNAKYNGGGVYVNGTFNIGGSPVIKDNTRDGTTPENAYLPYGDLTLIRPLLWKKTGTVIGPAAEIFISSPPQHPGAKFGTTALSSELSSEFDASLIFATDPDGNPLYGSISGENLVWTTSQSKPADEDFVAKISSTDTAYTSVATAIAEAQEGDIIVMINDTVEPTIIINRKVTLDLNGHVLKNNGKSLNTGFYRSVIMVESGGDLTVKDSSPDVKHKFRADQTTGLWTPDENGDKTVTGGCITGGAGTAEEESNSCGGGVYVAAGGTFTMVNGNIVGNTAKTSGGGVYVKGKFKVCGSPVIKGNTVNGAADNVYLNAADRLTLAGDITSGEILISKVKGKQIAAGQPFGLVAEGVTEGFAKFKNDTGTLFGMMNSANHTLIWGAAPPETPVLTAFTPEGGVKTAKVTDPASILQKVTTKENSNVSWLVFKPHETLGDLPVTIDERDVEIVDDSFKMIVGNLKAESQTNGSTSGSPQTDTDSVTVSSSGEDDTGPQPVPPSPDKIEPAAGIQATLSGKLKANLIDGQENRLRLAQKTDADKWVLLPVSDGKKTGDGYYTFDAAFTSTENGGYMFVIVEPVETPAEDQGDGTKKADTNYEIPPVTKDSVPAKLDSVSRIPENSDVVMVKCEATTDVPEAGEDGIVKALTAVDITLLKSDGNPVSSPLTSPAVITITIQKNNIPAGVNESNARIAHKVDGKWEILPGGASFNANGDLLVTGSSSILSPFAVVQLQPKSSSTSQGTSIWLTAAPTPTETPTPTPTVTPTPGTDAPSVNPLPSEKPSSPAPVMGVIAGLGCAAVVFGLRRK